jgi:hypothetical protein
MYKLFWTAAASLVASAAVVYLAADYTLRHPDSWLARNITACIRQPTVAAIRIHPAAPPTVASAPQVSHNKLTLQPEPEECPETPPSPPAVEASEPIQVGAPGETVECQAKDGDYNPQYPVPAGHDRMVRPNQQVPPEMQMCPEIDSSATYLPPSPPNEGNEDAPKPMPYLDEDPPANEEASCPFDAWFQWLYQKAGKKHAAPEGSESQTDMVPDDANPTESPECREDPENASQYSGCPHMMGCPCGRPGPAAPAAPPMPPKKHKKKLKLDPMSFLRQATPPHGEGSVSEEYFPIYGVDTMECRPSDTHISLKPNVMY